MTPITELNKTIPKQGLERHFFRSLGQNSDKTVTFFEKFWGFWTKNLL